MGLAWDDCLATGVEAIDEQHKKLITIANTLLDQVKAGKGRDSIRSIITQLREYTVHHFFEEEKYMEEIHFPDLGKHQSEHKNLVLQVKDFQRDIYQKKEVSPKDVIAFLKSWLLEHILKWDLAIAQFNKEQASTDAVEDGDAKGDDQASKEV